MNEILEKLELIDMWRIVNRAKKEYTFFSGAHGTFTKIEHVLGHRKMAKLGEHCIQRLIHCGKIEHNGLLY